MKLKDNKYYTSNVTPKIMTLHPRPEATQIPSPFRVKNDSYKSLIQSALIILVFCLQVTVYDQIIDFDAIPKYFPDGSDPNVDLPLSPGGPQNNMVPEGINVSFFFNYTQGIQK